MAECFKLLQKHHCQRTVIVWPVSQLSGRASCTGLVLIWLDSEFVQWKNSFPRGFVEKNHDSCLTSQLSEVATPVEGKQFNRKIWEWCSYAALESSNEFLGFSKTMDMFKAVSMSCKGPDLSSLVDLEVLENRMWRLRQSCKLPGCWRCAPKYSLSAKVGRLTGFSHFKEMSVQILADH